MAPKVLHDEVLAQESNITVGRIKESSGNKSKKQVRCVWLGPQSSNLSEELCIFCFRGVSIVVFNAILYLIAVAQLLSCLVISMQLLFAHFGNILPNYTGRAIKYNRNYNLYQGRGTHTLNKASSRRSLIIFPNVRTVQKHGNCERRGVDVACSNLGPSYLLSAFNLLDHDMVMTASSFVASRMFLL